MPSDRKPDLGLFVDILNTLERIGAPYMIIGAFAGTIYGINRVTYDIDIVVNLSSRQIQALSDAYPLPRYYADPVMIQNSIEQGIMFNIIDTERGEKADLFDMLVFHYSKPESRLNEKQMVDFARQAGEDVNRLWQDIKSDAMEEAQKNRS